MTPTPDQVLLTNLFLTSPEDDERLTVASVQTHNDHIEIVCRGALTRQRWRFVVVTRED